MKIGELAERSGLTVPALRFYERKGLFGVGTVKRLGNNYREYDESVLETLDLIKKAQTAGFSLNEIDSLLGRYKVEGPNSPEIRAALTEKLKELDDRITDIMAVRNIVVEKLHKRKKPAGK
ncbi:MAG: MerR family transcriptional regulator [Spirochaetales bacterium]|nr:MerR family transcriptional regulator [Spirochaetales bacterium]